MSSPRMMPRPRPAVAVASAPARAVARGALAAFAAGCALGIAAAHAGASDVEPGAPPADVIRSVIARAEQPALRWPHFADCQEEARRLYEPAGFAPLWVRDGRPTPQALDIIRVLGDAASRGLPPADYDDALLAGLAQQCGSGTTATAEQLGTFDTALTVSLLRYVSHVHLGRVHPRSVGFALDVEPKRIDVAQFVAELVTTDAPAARLATLDPPFALFERLVGALARMRVLAANSPPEIPDVPKLHPGESAKGVSAIRRFLRAVGDLPESAAPPKDANIYDPALVKAVKQFQDRHGLGTDGVIGEATLRQLRVPLAFRLRQIELALERLRWLPTPTDAAFLMVNIPEFRVRAYEQGETTPKLMLRAVVGSAAQRHETPILHANMDRVVFRPYWDVPPSIARKEIQPALKKDPDYLAHHDMEMHMGRIRQRPGPENALGLIKFVFPNPFSVYMHDTPTKKLFAQSRRDFSHGCVRVSDALALAEFVLQGQGSWDRARIEDAMLHGHNNRHVTLKRPVGVYVLYSTAVVDEDGTTRFFDDIYGHDERLETRLAKGYPYACMSAAPAPATPTPRSEVQQEGEALAP